MLIDIAMLVKKYDMDIEGIIHVGAHMAEEAGVYKQIGVERVFWIEGNPDLIARLTRRLNPLRKNLVIHALITDKDDDETVFHIANNGQSSSVLALETHAKEHPDVKYVKNKTLMSRTLDSLAAEHNYFDGANFMNLDLQGAELMALEGACNLLMEQIDYVYSEVNTKELYKGCARIDGLDTYLGSFGFVRFETSMTRHGWGDALYINKKNVK